MLYMQADPSEPPQLSPMMEGDDLTEFDEESAGVGLVESQRQTVEEKVE